MIPLNPQNRSDLIHQISDGIPSHMCREAILTGTVQVLGGFNKIPPSICPGWIIVITSKRGTIWTAALLFDEYRHKYRVMFVDEVPWEEWAGNMDRCLTPPQYNIYDGDNPQQAFKKWQKAHHDSKTPHDNCPG